MSFKMVTTFGRKAKLGSGCGVRLGLSPGGGLPGRLLAVSGLLGFFFFSLGRSGSEAPALLRV